MGDLIICELLVVAWGQRGRDGRESEDGVIRLPAIFRYLSRFGGKKFKIEIDSSIREVLNFQSALQAQRKWLR